MIDNIDAFAVGVAENHSARVRAVKRLDGFLDAHGLERYTLREDDAVFIVLHLSCSPAHSARRRQVGLGRRLVVRRRSSRRTAWLASLSIGPVNRVSDVAGLFHAPTTVWLTEFQGEFCDPPMLFGRQDDVYTKLFRPADE
jgi:hypothetical protein